MVESQPSKLLVAGSIPVSRSNIFRGAVPLGLPHTVARGGPVGPAPLRCCAASGRAGASLRSRLSQVRSVARSFDVLGAVKSLKGGLSDP